MFDFVSWHIGLRYVRSKRRNGFIAFISLFALLGMVLGVFALILVLSVMNGFDKELKDRILKVVPHGSITRQPDLTDWDALASDIKHAPGLMGSAPFIAGKGLVTFGSYVRPIEIQGIAPQREPLVSEIDQSMFIGEMASLAEGEYGIILGRLLARNLQVTIGDKVAVTLPVVSVTPAGVFPRNKRFTVVGVFEVGAQVDQNLALIHLADAQKLFRMPAKVDGLRLRFDDIYRAPTYVQNLKKNLGSEYEGQDWSETQGSLFKAVKMEKTVVGLMLSVIIAVAGFNIVTSLIMMVTEKRADIAVLRTLGLSRFGVIRIFMIQGTVMGVLGVVFGALLGVLAANSLSSIIGFLESLFGFQVFDQDVYFVTYLPSVWHWEDTLLTCLAALFVSFLATIYPAYQASKIAPAEALRYDI